MTSRAAQLAQILADNPGLTFGVPDGFFGNRPIYYTDGASYDARIASRSWIMDPEGISGTHASFAGWVLTLTRTTVPPWDVPEPWLLPAVTTGYSSPDDKVGTWGYFDPSLGVQVWWDVHRAGYLTPQGSYPLPPAWAISASPYKATDFRNASPTTTPAATTTTGGGSVTPQGPAGNPITGVASDRFLVNGTVYDGLGHALMAVSDGTVSDGSSNTVLLLGGLAAAFWYFSHAHRRR